MKIDKKKYKKRIIVFVTTTPKIYNQFLKTYIRKLYEEEFQIILFTPEITENLTAEFGQISLIYTLPIMRKIRIFHDICSLTILFYHLRNIKPDIIHSIMPKAGLLAMLAGKLAGINVRIHTFTGQIWANKQGLSRRFLKLFDFIIALHSSDCLADSPSQASFLESEGIISGRKITVLGSGSVAGVNEKIFFPDAHERYNIRESLSVSDTDILLLFMGRVNRDKGILDLVAGYKLLVREFSNIKLLIIGAHEDQLLIDTIKRDAPDVLWCSYTTSPNKYYNAADVLCLPSYREGFGSVIIEAAAAGTVSVASDIYGIRDAIVNGVTGLLHTPGMADEIAASCAALIVDSELRTRMAAAAQQRAREEFSSDVFASAIMDYYNQVSLNAHAK